MGVGRGGITLEVIQSTAVCKLVVSVCDFNPREHCQARSTDEHSANPSNFSRRVTSLYDDSSNVPLSIQPDLLNIKAYVMTLSELVSIAAF